MLDHQELHSSQTLFQFGKEEAKSLETQSEEYERIGLEHSLRLNTGYDFHKTRDTAALPLENVDVGPTPENCGIEHFLDIVELFEDLEPCQPPSTKVTRQLQLHKV